MALINCIDLRKKYSFDIQFQSYTRDIRYIESIDQFMSSRRESGQMQFLYGIAKYIPLMNKFDH